MVIVFWKRCFPSLRFSTRSALAQCGLFFLSEAVQSLMSPLKWGPCLNTVSFPLPCWWRISSKRVDSQGGLAEDCIVIPPVQGPLLTAVLPPGTSTRPLTFYPHFLLHLPEFPIFLCSGYRLGLQDVLWCALLLSSLYSLSSRCTEASKAKFASLWSVALLVHLLVLCGWEWPIHSLWTLFLPPTLLLCCVILHDKVIIFRILLSEGLARLSAGGRSKPFPRGLCREMEFRRVQKIGVASILRSTTCLPTHYTVHRADPRGDGQSSGIGRGSVWFRHAFINKPLLRERCLSKCF